MSELYNRNKQGNTKFYDVAAQNNPHFAAFNSLASTYNEPLLQYYETLLNNLPTYYKNFIQDPLDKERSDEEALYRLFSDYTEE